MIDWRSAKSRGLIELAGAGAVLMGLVFVGFELRQNTSAVEAATLQNLTDSSQEYLLFIASDVELHRIWRKAAIDPSELTVSEADRIHLLFRAQWIRYQDAFLQWRRGTLNDEDWRFYEGFVCRKVGDAGDADYRVATWEKHKPVLAERFVEFVESCWASDRYTRK